MFLFNFQPVLSQDGDEPSDYILNGEACWITVDSLSIWVRRMGDGVAIDVCPHGHEGDQTIASAYACFSDGH